MKYKFYLFPFIVLISGLFLVSANRAEAVGAAFFTNDTTVTMDVADFTIAGNSDADQVVTTSTTITITISAGQSFTFKSSGRKLLNVDGSYTSKTCSSSESSVLIAPAAGDSQRIVVITPQSSNCVDTSNSGGSGGSSSSGGGGGGGITTTPTPTPVSTSSPQATPTSSPAPLISSGRATPASRGFTNLNNVSLKDGDIISAAGSSDPDVYIVNPYGYKRLFLNPAIFGFYGHLGGFSKVKKTTSVTRDIFVTSGLFRNCEINDKKVYGIETTGEDIGILHWVNTTGDQAVKDDPDFFKKVFCINTKEFNWYKQGSAYISVNQIPDYSRSNVSSISSATPIPIVFTAKRYKVFNTDYLNIRELPNTSSKILGRLPAGEIIESLEQKDLWHKIKYQGKDAWVRSSYLKVL